MNTRYAKYPANPNRITLDLDPITADTLREAAKARKSTPQRLAYELVQRGLGVGVTMPASAAPAEEPDPFASVIKRGLDAISRPSGR